MHSIFNRISIKALFINIPLLRISISVWLFLLFFCASAQPSSNDSSANSNISVTSHSKSTNRKVKKYIAPSNSSLPSTVRNLREWGISCNPAVDETKKVMTAFHQASRGAFLLEIDCPVLLDSQNDIAKTVFIEDRTSVIINSNGQIIVTNLFHPAFALVNTDTFNALNWKIVYKNTNSTSGNVGGYFNNGVFVKTSKVGAPAYAFNNIVLKKWYVQNRGVTFFNTNPWWTGPTSNSAIFFLKGSAKNITFDTLKVSVPDSTRIDQYAPMVISFNFGPISNQKLTSGTLITASTAAVPSNLTFHRITLDGTYMGFLGSLRNATFKNIRSHHYGDLQKIDNSEVGGVDKWFPPPHLFYLSYNKSGDPSLFNENIIISDVIDYGQRKGIARDKGGSDTVSGYANSLKIGGVNVLVDHYESYRPDGFMDILWSNKLTLQNVKATYDSSFLNGVYPGIRFPAKGYKHVNLRNIVLQDLSPKTTMLPMTYANAPSNDYFTFQNITLKSNIWDSTKNDLKEKAGSKYSGAHNDILIRYTFQDPVHHQPTSILSGRKGSDSWHTTLYPSINNVGNTTPSVWTWSFSGAKSCQDSQNPQGSLPTAGRKLLTPLQARVYVLGLQCINMNGDKVTLTDQLIVQ
jgi:hypothetical protein